jgi:hypothetical protein
LYWKTDTYPDVISLYDDSATYKGAVATINYACTQSSGFGQYTGNVMIDGRANNFPAQKGGWCLNRTIAGTLPGNYYTTYLYCNSVKRDMMDASTCPQPTEPIDKESNMGRPSCPTT